SFRGRITQVSVLNALMLGRYDGVMPIPELLHCGDFGLGTLDHLDGELIVLDGRAYQVRGDGGVVAVGSDRSTPFALVIPSEPAGEFRCPGPATSPTWRPGWTTPWNRRTTSWPCASMAGSPRSPCGASTARSRHSGGWPTWSRASRSGPIQT